MKMEPNFWMSEEFVVFKSLEWVQDASVVGWKEHGETDWYFPPWDAALCMFRQDLSIFAGFLDKTWGARGGKWIHSVFLDHQYVYDPYQFNDPVGKKWKTYRKNIRKFLNRTNPRVYDYRRLKEKEQEIEIEFMLLQWSQDKVLYDPEVMVQFLFFGKYRWGLFVDGGLVGVNVGDENCRHRIFRYCLDNGAPFLNELMRHLFYTSPFAQQSGMLINDGGDLGNEGLARFKRRLNPISIHKVYSHERY